MNVRRVSSEWIIEYISEFSHFRWYLYVLRRLSLYCLRRPCEFWNGSREYLNVMCADTFGDNESLPYAIPWHIGVVALLLHRSTANGSVTRTCCFSSLLPIIFASIANSSSDCDCVAFSTPIFVKTTAGGYWIVSRCQTTTWNVNVTLTLHRSARALHIITKEPRSARAEYAQDPSISTIAIHSDHYLTIFLNVQTVTSKHG